ncbi:MAG: hybrid sensor histidine kinase/response regulator [Bacteroidetes bacterium GWD2_45_23]|nr:MAG: hybrid sensor histidine kinase/response regulator [Bacteroidetes bacterium GWC2_46_850]OFX85092.1 MAG: hybrid sensor histidine kinase/response regulator [Bacteroidetes bacterium GWD2_45_23]HBB00410.1 hybrid sensor histidine kinase/response regulator [Porphyromonadaceae bacterium]HCC18391.1 hybrid sensor histidine kinase/response regulator [Porphyromonadaceae bacterium]
MKRKVIYLIGILLLQSVFLHAQKFTGDTYNIQFVTMDNGLLHHYIDDIYKDKTGYLWFSTGGGLSRYDGYKFVHYNMNSAPVALKGNFIHKVCEDNFSRLWIASEGGLDVLDLRKNEKVDLFSDVDTLRLSFPDTPVINILKDSKGDIWLYSNSIYKIGLKDDGSIQDILLYGDELQSELFVALADIDNDGNIWAGFNNEVFKLFPAASGQLEAVSVSDKLQFDTKTMIMKFLLKENDVWIGTDRGLYRYFINEDVLKIYRSNADDPHALSHDYVSELALTDSRQLIAGTLKGINLYNSSSDAFDQIAEDNTTDGLGLNSNFINTIFYEEGILWLGTETGGVNKLSPGNSFIRNYTHDKNIKGSISRNPVNVILEDEKEQLWIGTVEGGLNLKRKDQESFTHYTSSSTARLSHNSVSALSMDGEQRLWTGTWGYGVTLLNMNDADKGPVKYINTGNYPGFFLDFVGALSYDKLNNAMWIGTNQGLFYYDIEKDSLQKPFRDNLSDHINGIIGSMIDSDNQLWLGCSEGVYVIDLNKPRDSFFSYDHLKYKLDNPQSKLVERITSFCIDTDGILWLGSDGFGIYKRTINDDGSYSFQSFTTSHGLANNNVKGLLEDDKGNLWISTINGLSCYNKKTDSFTNYYEEDGLVSGQFYWNAYIKTKSGLLYFGTLNGLVAVNPEMISSDAAEYRVTLTDFYVNNERINPGRIIREDISVTDKITLHEKTRSFSIDFSALNYRAISNYVYAYQLVGYDESWIELDKDGHSVTYMNLPAGNYEFQVKYVPKDQLQTGEITQISVYIKPYFYKTGWFISLMILLAILVVIMLHFWRVRSYEHQQKVLKQIVDDRTGEIEKQKEVLTAQKNELSQRNELLSSQNEKITRQKEQLVGMSQKMRKMTTERLDFFTNISHEFRTPITLIVGPVERALKLSTNPYVIEQLNFAERNARYLLTLINQLMDFRKIESNKLEIIYTAGNFQEFMESVISPFEFQAGDRDIQILRRFDLEDRFFYYDDEGLRKIMTNLLSNAIKYTPNKGEITVYAKSFSETSTNSHKLYIAVKDSGAGVPEEDKEKVFRRFYQSSNHLRYPVHGQSGTGIGLYLTKQVVEALGGNIWLKNNKKAGTTFRIVLPLHKLNPQVQVMKHERRFPADEEDLHVQNLRNWQKERLTFLVVEDNRDMCRYVCSLLSPYYNTLEAGNGVEALKILEHYNVDFIISDLMMPEMDGLELSKNVKENFTLSHIPFLMLTAKTSEKARTDSYRMGVDSYIVKPFDEDMLIARIRNILETRERYQQRFIDDMSVDILEISEESNDKKFMDRVLVVMKENYQNSYFEVSDFAETVGVSKSLMNKKLKALSGKSAGEFIRIYRLNLAYNIILQNKKTKNKNIADIAYEVGFNDPKYFTRCFSKQFDITPSKLLEK